MSKEPGSTSKQALLLKRLSGAAARSPRIPRRPEQAHAALSFAQQRLWLLDQLLPGTAVYNLPSAWRMEGKLDAKLLEQSLNLLIERHEGLRTTFSSTDGLARQVIHPQLRLTLPVVDLRQVPVSARDEEARRLGAADAELPFDLEQGPLVRGQLLQLGDQEHQLLLTLHHITSDGWSMGVLMRELAAEYGALVRGEPSSLLPLPIQYADFAVWQREWLQGPVLESQIAYWTKQLGGAAPLELPMDRARPPALTYRGAQKRFVIPRDVTQRLQALCRKESVTAFMALLAGFKVLLHRYSGQTDICVGTPIAGRNRSELEWLVGFFVNTLVMRTEVSGQLTFRELLGRVRETALGAYARQDVPFQKLVEVLKPERSMSRTPLFQAMFVFQDIDPEILELPGVRVTSVRPEVRTEMFDLTLTVVEEQGIFAGVLSYSADLFDEGTIERMTGHLVRLLEQAVAQPDKCIGDLDLLTQEERQRILVEWNDTATDYPRRCIHQLFEEQAERTPEAVAVALEGAQLTYRELNRRANQLAHRLKKLGVGPDMLVGIVVERSFEMVIGLLGILKAGGAYLPLDPANPRERLAFIINDAGVSVVAALRRLAPSLPAFPGQVVWLDDEALGLETEQNPETPCSPQNLAYALFTSGSTGTPKGVCVPHGGVVRLVRDTGYVPFSASDVYLQFVPLSFDVSTFEIWAPLLNGARVCLVPPGPISLHEFGEQVKRHGVTTLWLTVGLFHQVVDAGLEAYGSVRHLFSGGDVISATHVRKVLAQLPECTVHNGYGPTENTTYTSCHAMRSPIDVRDSVSIGRPIANTDTYVLDERLRPVPVGVPGRLFTGGVGLARGYLGRADLTAERFIPNPFSSVPGARIYDTGDFSRYLPDGTIEFLGRRDSQVKVRGFRIELGEVESALLAQPSVLEAVVIAREDTPGDRRLVAYLVPKEGASVVVEAVRGALQKSLPEYMVPAAFVPMLQLPLTSNGKVDRKALPPPEWGADRLAYVAPGTPVEEVLAVIWAQVLSVARVGLEDNFFTLGGHSLSAARVISRVLVAFKVKVPLRSMFEQATLGAFAKVVENLVIEDLERLTEAEASAELNAE